MTNTDDLKHPSRKPERSISEYGNRTSGTSADLELCHEHFQHAKEITGALVCDRLFLQARFEQSKHFIEFR